MAHAALQLPVQLTDTVFEEPEVKRSQPACPPVCTRPAYPACHEFGLRGHSQAREMRLPGLRPLVVWHVDMCGENSPKTQVKCVGRGSPRQVTGALIYNVSPFPAAYELEPTCRMVLFRLMKL